METNVNNVRREREVVDLLLKEGLIDQEKLAKAREETRRTGLSMGNALEKLGYITYEDIIKVQATALGLPYMDLSDYIVDAGLVELIPVETAKKHKAVPLFKIGNTLTVGMVDPKDIEAIDNIRRISKVDMVEPVLVSERGIQKVIDSYYGAGETVDAIVKSIDEKKVLPKGGKVFGKSLDDTPVIDLINIMFAQAVKDRVSDMHLEPTEETLRVRFRVDGLLREVTVIPKAMQSAIISRIKILSKMDIAESRKPQDGRIRLKLENKDLDIRVSTFPTLHGENVVMRLLDKTSVLLGLKEVGMLENDLKLFEKVIRRPNGIILVTGPTGSGKTSTLYAALTVINSIEKNIVTIEDPAEYELPLIRQTQVNPLAGVTFANGLRGILRQDPDVIMVGEIRDKETADVAIQAALTGHLVFSTLHTNDAASALTRLIDMGVEPFLASSSVVGILAQRLVRLICDKCREPYSPAADVLKDLDFKTGTQFFRGKGCPKCNNTGLKGRTGIFELLVITEEIRTLIDEKKSADEIGRKARESGMRTLRDDGLLKAKEGLTTLEEVLRVTEVE